MSIWRVKSKTGSTVHLTFDMEKTFCGRTIGEDWQFLFLLNDRTEALEHVDGLCGKCNTINLKEWEKEFVDDSKGSEPKGSNIHSERHDRSKEEESANKEVGGVIEEPIIPDSRSEEPTPVKSEFAKPVTGKRV